MSVCGAVAALRTLAKQTADALSLITTAWWFEPADQLWLAATSTQHDASRLSRSPAAEAALLKQPLNSPAPPSRSGMPGDRPEAAATTGSAQGNLAASGHLQPSLMSHDLWAAARCCRFHGNNTYPESRRDKSFDLAERLENVAAALKTLEDTK